MPVRRHAYMLKTGASLAPLGKLARIMIHNQPLPQQQEARLEQLGCEVHWIDSLDEVRHFPCLLVHDDLYFTRAAVRRFLRQASSEAAGRNGCQAALRVNLLTEALVPELQGPRVDDSRHGPLRSFDMFWLRDRDAACGLAEQTCSVPISAPYTRLSSRTHRCFAPSGRFEVPLSTVFLSPVRHWANVVGINMNGMAAFLAEQLCRRPAAAAMLPLRAALRAGSLRPARLAGKTYLSGRRCRVHPTAHVEGAVLGNRVRIGPHAVVRFSALGNGAVIGAGASLEGCSVGPCTNVNNTVVLRGTTIGEGASIGTFFNQLSVIGRRVVMCPDSGILDFNLRGTVPVTVDGQTVRTGSMILGSALGDDVFLGPGVHIACGRELPAGCVLVESPRQMVRGGDVQQLPENVRRLDRGHRRRAA